MRHAFRLLLAAVLSAGSCLAQSPPPAPEPVWPPGTLLRPAELAPLAFLDALRARRDAPHGVRVHFPPPGWVRREDVPALLALIRSTEPIAVTCGIVAAHAPPPEARSTLGREAMRLIKGYRRGSFPFGCSNLAPPGDPDEVERWWAAGGPAP